MPPKGWKKYREIETTGEPLCPSGTGHVWLLLKAAGPQSLGRCRDCGEERDFNNSLPIDQTGQSWRETRNSGLGRLRPAGPRP